MPSASACICVALLGMPSLLMAQETVSLSSQAELAHAADSVRQAYHSSQAELARAADSVRKAYRSSQSKLAREADSVRKAYQDSLKSGPNNQATSYRLKSPVARSATATSTPVSQPQPEPQVHLAEPSPRFIRGFAGIPWGTWPAGIIKKKGKPATRREESDILYLSYQESLVGNQASALYLVSKREGLVKGDYSVAFNLEQGCETVFNQLVDAIKAKYPEIEPTESRYNGTLLDFCDGVLIGDAGWTVSWYDPANHRAVIGVALSPGARKVQVHYQSPAFSSGSENSKESYDPF
jgi:hypothetical protein